MASFWNRRGAGDLTTTSVEQLGARGRGPERLGSLCHIADRDEFGNRIVAMTLQGPTEQAVVLDGP